VQKSVVEVPIQVPEIGILDADGEPTRKADEEAAVVPAGALPAGRKKSVAMPRAYHAAMMGMMSRLAALFRRRLILL
jgi:hypothetical protein